MLGLGMGRTLMKVALACACVGILLKLFGAIDCNSKKFDCRRCVSLRRFLLWSGYDDFEGTTCIITVHSITEAEKVTSFGGDCEFKVTVAFGWSKFETAPIKEMRWETTKKIEIPQGQTECQVSLQLIGAVSTSTVGTLELETKSDMLDKGDGFWGKKQKLKLEKDGKPVGKVIITFRRISDGDEEGGSFAGGCPLEEVDEGSALAVEIMNVVEELANKPGYVMPKKWEGNDKIMLMAKCIEGPLRLMDEKTQKPKNLVYICVKMCNIWELSGGDAADVKKQQQKKAKDKGLATLEQKWYWCVYGTKKDMESSPKDPDDFMLMAAIKKVGKQPKTNDQFIVEYAKAGAEKSRYIFKRETGKGIEVWVDGIDLTFNACREMIKESKAAEDRVKDALPQMRRMHAEFVKQRGHPAQAEDSGAAWKAWFEYFTSNNYDRPLIEQLWAEIKTPPGTGAVVAKAPSNAAAGGKGAAPAKAAAAAPADKKKAAKK